MNLPIWLQGYLIGVAGIALSILILVISSIKEIFGLKPSNKASVLRFWKLFEKVFNFVFTLILGLSTLIIAISIIYMVAELLIRFLNRQPNFTDFICVSIALIIGASIKIYIEFQDSKFIKIVKCSITKALKIAKGRASA